MNLRSIIPYSKAVLLSLVILFSVSRSNVIAQVALRDNVVSDKTELRSGDKQRQIFRTINKPFGAEGTTAWISFSMIKQTGKDLLGVFLYQNDKAKLFIGTQAAKDQISLATALVQRSSALTAHQLFVRIDFHQQGDIAYLFIDPNLSSDPDVEGADATIRGSFAFDRIGLTIGATGDPKNPTTGSIGPIRAGYKFADVAAEKTAQSMPVLKQGAKLRIDKWARSKDGLTITTSGGTLKLIPYLNNVLNVRFGGAAQVEANKSFAVSRQPADISFDVKESNDDLILTTANYSARISKASSQIRVYDQAGKLLLQESAQGARAAVNRDSVTVADVFQLGADEALYGTGQFRDGAMNLRGKRRELVQMNTQAAIPVILSTNGWGMFWDNPSRTIFDDNDKGLFLSSDLGKAISYYVFVGAKFDDLISAYRDLTGTAPMIPRWAFGYHQSRNKYATQQEVLEVAARMRKEHIPMSSIFIDYYYWGKYGTGSHHFDEAQFPDLKKMISTLHNDLHTKVIATVWPTFKPGSPNYEELNSNGALLNEVRALDGVVYDAFSPKASQLYWKQVASQLIPTGIDGWFLDGPEPDNVTSFLKSNTFAGPAPTVRNLFPLMHSTTFYNGLLSIDTNKRPYILTRCAWASQQKNGTAIWSGDIGSTFDELKKQITAGLNFTAAGIPYWTTDIGGYSGGNPQDPQYREVFTRWWQYGVFCPVFRSHGRRYPGDTKGPNELWAYGPEVQGICTDYDMFRYRLMPYIYSLAGDVTQKNYTPMRLLAFDFGDDKNVLNIKDQFMYGPALLVNPVTVQGATSRQVYLPKGSTWTDLWTGQTYTGGQTITANAPLSQMPLFVKAGSIIPLGPAQQYVDETKPDAIELRVYPGANGQFELYEDDGDTFNYKKGRYSRILMQWDDTTQTLTIGKQQNGFEEMIKDRTFTIVRVDKANGIGLAGDKPLVTVKYTGEQIVVKYPKQ